MSTMPSDETLTVTRDGDRVNITFNRPDQRNAMNNQLSHTLIATLEWLAENEDVRVVVLRGAGGHFSAGGDIKERRAQAAVAATGREDILERNIRGGRMFSLLQGLPQTTISVVEGSAFGGGMGIACTTDITILSTTAKMGMPETTLGVAPAQISPYVVRRVGLPRARQLALTAQRFDGAKAYDYGVGQYLCQPDELENTLEEVVGQVLQCGPRANAATKRIMAAVGTMPDDELSRYSAEEFADLNTGQEGKEGQAAFAEKRKPRWQEN